SSPRTASCGKNKKKSGNATTLRGHPWEGAPDVSSASHRRKILAVSSSGGHWSELLRLAPALEGHQVTWVTTSPGYRDTAPPGEFFHVRDASMWNKKAMLVLLGQIAKIVARM